MNKVSKSIGIASLAAFALAIVCGIVAPGFCKSIEVVGTIYVNLLKIMIVPVLFTSIAAALAADNTSASLVTLKTIGVFIAMFVASFIVCCLMWNILKPGVNAIFEEIKWDGELTSLSFKDFLLSLVPTNIITAMSGNAILPVIIFAAVFGIAIRSCKLKKLAEITGELSTAFAKMLSYVMYLTPAGVFALMGSTVANYGGSILGVAAKYIGCAYLGCALIAFLVMILPVWIYCGITPGEYIRKVYKVWIMAMTTCSSAATLPVTMRTCNEEFGVPERITGIVVPLGCTIHMCGGAVSFSLLAMFNMQMYGIKMSMWMFVLMLIAALLLNMGAPGLPGGGIVLGATYLSILGIPLNFIGFYAGIYRLLDMAYTTMNVSGDITANLLIDRMIRKASDKSREVV